MSTDPSQQATTIEPPPPPSGLQELLLDLVATPPESYEQKLQLAQVLTQAWNAQVVNAQVVALQQSSLAVWESAKAQNNAAAAFREQAAVLASPFNAMLEIVRNASPSGYDTPVERERLVKNASALYEGLMSKAAEMAGQAAG